MYFNQLTLKLLEVKDSYLSRWDFPEKIFVPNPQTGGFMGFGAKNIFWEKIAELRKYTDSGSDGFSEEYSGSTGWEYEMMMAYVNGRYFYSRPSTSKNYTQVSSSHSLKIDLSQDGNIVVDSVSINGKPAGSIRYVTAEERKKRNQAIQNNEYKAGYLCHFHTHPRIKEKNQAQVHYTFFSPQDIHSLFAGRTPMLGLVADKLWIVAKTKESLAVVKEQGYLPELGNDLAQVSFAEKRGWDEMYKAAAIFFEKYQLAGYVAEFGGTLGRVNQ